MRRNIRISHSVALWFIVVENILLRTRVDYRHVQQHLNSTRLASVIEYVPIAVVTVQLFPSAHKYHCPPDYTTHTHRPAGRRWIVPSLQKPCDKRCIRVSGSNINHALPSFCLLSASWRHTLYTTSGIPQLLIFYGGQRSHGRGCPWMPCSGMGHLLLKCACFPEQQMLPSKINSLRWTCIRTAICFSSG